MRKSGKPAWWKLDLIVPVTIGLLVLLHRLGLAAPWQQVGQVVVVGVSFGWMSLWTWRNAATIEQEGQDRAEQERMKSVVLTPGQAPPMTVRQAHYRQVMSHAPGSRQEKALAAQDVDPTGLGDL